MYNRLIKGVPVTEKVIGACEALCGKCTRNEFEKDGLDQRLEEVIATFPVSEAMNWMDEIDFLDPRAYEGDFKRIGDDLGVSAEQAASVIFCAVMRVNNVCEVFESSN